MGTALAFLTTGPRPSGRQCRWALRGFETGRKPRFYVRSSKLWPLAANRWTRSEVRSLAPLVQKPEGNRGAGGVPCPGLGADHRGVAFAKVRRAGRPHMCRCVSTLRAAAPRQAGTSASRELTARPGPAPVGRLSPPLKASGSPLTSVSLESLEMGKKHRFSYPCSRAGGAGRHGSRPPPRLSPGAQSPPERAEATSSPPAPPSGAAPPHGRPDRARESPPGKLGVTSLSGRKASPATQAWGRCR